MAFTLGPPWSPEFPAASKLFVSITRTYIIHLYDFVYKTQFLAAEEGSASSSVMNVSNMLSESIESHPTQRLQEGTQREQNNGHSYPTRRMASIDAYPPSFTATDLAASTPRELNGLATPSTTPKTVSFELLVDEARNARARLPMRVQIHPHDSTEDIIASVKSFFGLYDPQGISFEDNLGNTLIARYENFQNNSTVPVRVITANTSNNEVQTPWGYKPTSPQKLREFEEPISLPPPHPAQILNYGQPLSRPASRVSRKESISPKMTQARPPLASKSRSRSGAKSQGSSFQNGLDELNDAHNGYSSSDGVAASVASSRKARSEQLATAEISVDNIVEGGRRKRAKFESSVSILISLF